MIRKFSNYFIQSLISCIFICIPAFSESGKTEVLKKTIDLSKLSGVNLVLAKLYNENLFLYSIVSLISMALLGIILATIAEFLFGKLGLTIKKTEIKAE
jgi:hypothetical protein